MNRHILRVAAGCVLALTACSAPPPEIPAPAPPTFALPEGPPTRIEKPAAPADPDAALPADPLHRKLVGTVWTAGAYEIAFVSGAKVRLSGGDLREFFPSGVTAGYRFSDGVVEFSMLGKTQRGEFDGEGLLLEGKPAQRVEP